ncbi:MAG: O-methyltransferase [Anaerolineae bacterium]
MDPAVFEVITELEMRDEGERRRELPPEQRILAVHPDAARLLHILAVGAKARSIVEIGTGHGYATLWLAMAARKYGGKVLTCEIDPTKAGEARRNFARAGLDGSIELLVGDARELLRGRDTPVDFVFIDAAKDQYEMYFDVLYKQTGLGSMIVADNVVSHEDELADYVTYVQNHPNLESATVPIGRGLEISVKIS